MVVQVTVRKWGNSLGIRLKKIIADQLNLSAGTRLDIDVEDGRMVVAPSSQKPSLDEFLGKITPQNLHGENDLGESVGNEIW